MSLELSDDDALQMLRNQLDGLLILFERDKKEAGYLRPLPAAVGHFASKLCTYLHRNHEGVHYEYHLIEAVIASLRAIMIHGSGAIPQFSEAYSANLLDGLTVETAKDNPIAAAKERIIFLSTTGCAATRLFDLYGN